MALLPMRGYKRKPFPALDTDNEGIKHFIVDEFQRLENTLETHKQAVDVTVTENEVVKNSVTSLTATVNSNTADITTEQTVRANADSALASDITSLTAAVGSNTSAITAEQTARANADSALASDITSLTTTVGSNTSAITAEQTARANADTALASDITSLTSTVNGVSASVTTEASTRASADTALGSDITSLEAKYGVKLNVNGYITGFQQNNDGTTGSFKILADEFKVVNPSASSGQAGTEVFGISGNQVTMQNVKVGTAVIDDLAVTNAKIGNLQVTSGKIGSLAVATDKIANQAVNAIRTTATTTATALNDNVWTTVGSISFTPASVGGVAQPISVKSYLSYSAEFSGTTYKGKLYVRVRRGSTTLSEFQVGEYFEYASSIGGGYFVTQFKGLAFGSVTPIYLDTNTTVASRTYTIECKYVASDSRSNPKWQIPAGAIMECVEVKR